MLYAKTDLQKKVQSTVLQQASWWLRIQRSKMEQKKMEPSTLQIKPTHVFVVKEGEQLHVMSTVDGETRTYSLSKEKVRSGETRRKFTATMISLSHAQRKSACQFNDKQALQWILRQDNLWYPCGHACDDLRILVRASKKTKNLKDALVGKEPQEQAKAKGPTANQHQPQAPAQTKTQPKQARAPHSSRDAEQGKKGRAKKPQSRGEGRKGPVPAAG